MRILAAVACIAVSISAFAQEVDPVQRLQTDVPAMLATQGHVLEDMNKLIAARAALMTELTNVKKERDELAEKIKMLESKTESLGDPQ